MCARRLGLLGLVLSFATACVDVPVLARNNPCDPAVGGPCTGEDPPDEGASTDAEAPDLGVDAEGIADATVDPADGAPPDDGTDGPELECDDPEPEACNGVDDDCDGEVDELAPIACYSGPVETRNVGACRTGVIECEAGRWTICAGAVVPEAERCDQADNDCDGITDEAVVCD